jgi:hypothetical protein
MFRAARFCRTQSHHPCCRRCAQCVPGGGSDQSVQQVRATGEYSQLPRVLWFCGMLTHTHTHTHTRARARAFAPSRRYHTACPSSGENLVAMTVPTLCSSHVCLRTVLLSCSETWTTYTVDLQRLETIQMSRLRRICGDSSWGPKSTPYAELRRRCQIPSIQNLVTYHRLQWLGKSAG